MTEVLAVVRWNDAEEPFNSKKVPGDFSASAHELGSSRKSSEITFRLATSADVAAYIGAPSRNTDSISRYEHDRRQFELSDEHKEVLQAFVRWGLVKGYEWAAPRAESLIKDRAIPYVKERIIPYGAARLQKLREARKARRRAAAAEPEVSAVEPQIVAAPQTSERVALEEVPGVPGFALEPRGPEMSAEEARHLRATAEAMRAWADRLDEHVDRSRVVPERELLELGGSAATIPHEQLAAGRMPELEVAPATAGEDALVAQLRKLIGAQREPRDGTRFGPA
ncbi:hypothetical protein [Micromonospora carbonacea]|uniref:Uncharacterized protein n=1 Tax=Micromonospora carbonacea TaxID=47853 RepID=A0A7H8XED8_9ACTN|nr:hypothetical protein [Micromonospora carbonacea]MBB5829053.1 hypothetical protein [Micromonospora carbonacea]QLD23436.1 hypothetical protein HXZ27_03730 [Micromonospora carbonacea]